MTTNKVHFIRKRCVKLLIPYFVMGLLYIPFRVVMSEYARNEFRLIDTWKMFVGQNPDGSLWFLYMLFLISALALFVVNERTVKACLFIFFLSWSASCLYKPDNDIMLSLCRYTFMFAFGAFCRTRYTEFCGILLNRAVIIMSVIVFALSNFMNIRCASDVFLPLSAVAGTLLTVRLSKFIADRPAFRASRFMEWLSAYCMEIYIFSEPVKVALRIAVKKLSIDYRIGLWIVIAGAIFIPIALTEHIIRKHNILSLLFLGKVGRSA